MIFNIKLLSRLIWDSSLLPVDALVYIHHLGIWLVSWSPAPRWAVTEGTKKTDTSISQRSCQNLEGICKRRGSVFFSSSMSRSLLCFLMSNRIHCPAVLLSLCVQKRKWVCVRKCLWVLFSRCKWTRLSLCVHLSVLPRACVCIFREGTESLRDRHPATTHCEDYPQIQCLCGKSRDFSLPTYVSSKWIFA